MSDVVRQEDYCSATICPRAKDLSNGKVPGQLSARIQFQLSDVAGQKFYCQSTDCPRAVLKNSSLDIRYSVSVEAESFLGVPRGLPITLVLVKWSDFETATCPRDKYN